MFRYALCAALTFIPASADAMIDLYIETVSQEPGLKMAKLYLPGTTRGRRIVCAIYDLDDKIIASTEEITDNLATSVTFYGVTTVVASARCVFND